MTVRHSRRRDLPAEQRLAAVLADLRKEAGKSRPAISGRELRVLIECVEIVETDYLLLSQDQQAKAYAVLAELEAL